MIYFITSERRYNDIIENSTPGAFIFNPDEEKFIVIHDGKKKRTFESYAEAIAFLNCLLFNL